MEGKKEMEKIPCQFKMNVISPEKIAHDMALPIADIISCIGNSEQFISRNIQRHEFKLKS